MANEFKIKKGLIVTGASGGTVVDIQGSQGQLFSVTDNLSGSIFAVSDISGVPIFDVNSSGLSTFDGNVNLPDNNKLLLGTGNDLEIYHNGSDSYIKDAGAGDLRIVASKTRIYDADLSHLQAQFTDGGSVDLYYSGNKKFETTSTGVTVTGKATITNDIILSQVGPRIDFDNGSAGSLRLFSVSENAAAITITSAGNLTAAGQGFSAATSSGDGSSTLTTKGYVDSLITGATIYRGTWDPDVSLNSGYGNPNLNTVTQTSGYYYICSADGAATPNGATTEPNSWNTGDWVIWNDDIGASGEWQKIDNSSVLSGVGTGQTVALWEGASSVTDSETLGNAPITVSGNNSTFAGTISSGAITSTANISGVNLIASTAVYSGGIFYGSSTLSLKKSNGNSYVDFDTNLNATFAGNVALTGDLRVTADASTADIVAQWADSNGNNTATFRTTTPGQIFEIRSQNNGTLKFDSPSATFTGQININSGNDLRLYRSDNATYARFNYAGGSVGLDIDDLNGDGINLQQAGVNKLRIETSGNATFAGKITSGNDIVNATAGVYTWTGDTDTFIQRSAANEITFKTGASNALILDSSQNATFAGEVSLKSRLNLQRSSAGATTLIQFKNEIGADRAHIDFGGTNEELSFFAGDGTTENMTINSAGNATFSGLVSGITPVNAANFVTKAYVDGSGGGTGPFLPLAGGTITGNLTVNGTTTLGNQLTFPYGYLSDYIYHTGDSNTYFGFVSNDNFIVATSGAERMRINGSGNVGIGTTGPTSSVHVNGLQTNSGSTSAHLPTGTMRLNFAGASSADEYGASLVFTQRWWTNSTGEVAMGQIAGVKETGNGNYGGGLAFFTSNNTSNNLLERLRINELGNVGIGTISPSQKLEVIGNISSGLSSTTTRTALIANTFGYSTSWKTLTLGSAGTNYQTDAVSLCFNVLLNQNSSGSFTGNGSEYFWRNTGSFKTPNSGNNGYNTILNWNSSGKILNLAPYNGITFADGQEAVDGAAQIIPPPGRSSSPDPEDYQRSFSTEFKGKTASGSPGTGGSWIGLISMSPYRPSTSGFYTTQLGFGADGTNGDMFIRRGTTTTWGSWDKFLTQGNSGTGPFLPLSAGPSYPLTGNLYQTMGAIGVAQTDQDYLAKIYESNADGFMSLYTGQPTPLERIRISSYGDSFFVPANNGNVGIGTTSPSATLHVAKNIDAGNAEIILENSFTNTASSTDERTQIQGRFGGWDGSYIITGKEGDYTTAALRKSYLAFSTRTATTGMTEKMRIDSTGNVGITAAAYLGFNGAGDPSHSVAYNAGIDGVQLRGQNGVIFGTGGGATAIERMRINSAGAIKFNNYDSTNNTGTPTYLLGTDASGNVVKTLSSSAPGSLWAASGNDIYNTNSADVGIGITNPDSKLTVSSGTTNAVANFKSTDANAYIAIADNSSTNALVNQIGVTGNDMWFATDDVERMRITSAGELQVTGNGVIRNEHSSANYSYWQQTSTDARLFTQYAQPLYFGTNASTRMTILSGGNVGIGTTSPVTNAAYNKLLHINATSGVGAVLKLTDTNSGSGANNGLEILQYAQESYFINRQNGAMFFYANNNPRMTILPAGNVGIGTTAPNNLLNLQRNVAGGDVAAYIQNFNGDVGSTDETASVKFAHGNDGVVGYVGGKLVCGKEGDFETSIANIKGNLQFYTASGTSLDSDVNNIERMRIDSAGNVGIGTTTPLAKLDIQGTQGQLFSVTDDLSGSIFAVSDISGVPIFDVNSSGKVGINTTSANDIFDVRSSSWATRIQSTTDGTYLRMSPNQIATFNSAGAGSPLYLNHSSSGNIIMAGGGGNVGIGTTSPTQKLHLDGNNYNTATRTTFLIRDVGNNYDQGDNAIDIVMRSRYWSGDQNTSQNSKIRHLKDNSNGSTGTQLRFSTTTRGAGDSSDKMTILASGNVGIGTASPAAKLVVSDGTQAFSVNPHSTGIDLHSTGNLAPHYQTDFTLYTGAIGSGSARVTVNSAGNVGIGTTSPSTRLEVAASATTSVDIAHFSNSNDVVKIKHALDGVGSGMISIFDSGNNEDVRLSAQGNSWFNAGNVGINNSVPNEKLSVRGNIELVGEGVGNCGVRYIKYNCPDEASYNVLGLTTSTANFITKVGINKTSPAVKLDVSDSIAGSGFTNGVVRFENSIEDSTGGAGVLNIQNNYQGGFGTLIKFWFEESSVATINFNSSTNAVVYNTTSDYRLKEDLKSFNGLEIIDQIKTYNYKWKKADARGYGALAHELQEVFPDAVTGEKDGEDMQGVDYSTLVPVLIKSIQELKAEIELLKQQINN